MNILVYKYGLGRPLTNEPLVREQLRLANKHYNNLIAVEVLRRTAERSFISAVPGMAIFERAAAEATEVFLKLHKEIKDTRQASRSRSESDLQKAALETARLAKQQAVDSLKLGQAWIREDPSFVAEYDRIHELATELAKNARAYCGVFWGTSALAADAAGRARKDTPIFDDEGLPNDPEKHHFTGEGAVGVQIIGGMPAESATGCKHTSIRVEEGSTEDLPAAWVRKGKKRGVLYLRVGSDDKRGPVWATWPLVLHRPLPAGATIQQAAVHVHRVGPREEWYVTFTLRMPAAPPVNTDACAESVGLDVGWRQFDDGSVRVCAWSGSDGQQGELRLSAHEVNGIRRAETLEATRDKMFDTCRQALLTWLSTNEVPSWMREDTETLSQWKSQGRLAALAIRWRVSRFDGDSSVFESLEDWRRQDKHLWLWETSQRTGALRLRKNTYRVFARELSRKYRTAVLEDFKLPAVIRRKDEPENETARSNRHLVAISELREVVKHAFVNVAVVAAANTTRQCHECGVVEAFNAAARLRFTCQNGHEWDQDENAAKNIRERRGCASPTRGARKKKKANSPEEVAEPRWVRVRRLKAERRERMEAARKADAKPVE